MASQLQSSPAEPGRKRQITRTAAVLFDRHGFHETSMDDIAREVGLKKPTLYHYVRSKGQIVHWIHEELATELHDRLRHRLEQEVSPSQNLLEVIYDILGVMETHPGHLRVYFESHRHLPEEYQTRARDLRDAYLSMVEGVIAKGIARGELRQTPNIRLTTLALFGMCNWSYQWYRPEGSMRARDVAYHMWDVFMRGAALPNGKPSGLLEAPDRAGGD